MFPQSSLSLGEIREVLGEEARSLMAESGASHYNFCLLSNVRGLSCAEPFEVVPGGFLRRASSKEAAAFRRLVCPPDGILPLRYLGQNPYEQRLVRTPSEPGPILSLAPLPESEFRYHIMAFPGSNAAFHSLVESSALTPWQLVAGPQIQLIGDAAVAIVGSPDHARYIHEDRYESNFIALEQADLVELRAVHSKLTAFQHDSVKLKAAVRNYYDLGAIPPGSPLRFLGCVSVLESVVTHDPRPNDPYDSLTRQVCQKMLLLQRRFGRPLSYDGFLPAKPSTVWKLLYQYRSAVAHGAPPDFAKTLRVLKGPAEALSFMEVATRRLLRQALEEPDLVGDLREC